jgi:hypothetical protein
MHEPGFIAEPDSSPICQIPHPDCVTPSYHCSTMLTLQGPERNFPAGQGQTTRCTFNDGLPAKSEHYSDSMAVKMARFKSNRTPMG